MEGITFFGEALGRHQNPDGYEADCAKYNRAIQLGWKVLRYTQRMLTRSPRGVVRQIRGVIESTKPHREPGRLFD